MSNETGAAAPKWMTWVGWAMSGLVGLALIGSGIMKLSHPAEVITMFVGKFGYPEGLLSSIGIVELLCVVLYLIPRTAVLGAILVAAYLGGAVATHVRIGDVFVAPLVLGVLAWGGLYLRDDRVRALIPLR